MFFELFLFRFEVIDGEIFGVIKTVELLLGRGEPFGELQAVHVEVRPDVVAGQPAAVSLSVRAVHLGPLLAQFVHDTANLRSLFPVGNLFNDDVSFDLDFIYEWFERRQFFANSLETESMQN